MELALETIEIGQPIIDFSGGGSNGTIATLGAGWSWSVEALSQVKRYNESVTALDNAYISGRANFAHKGDTFPVTLPNNSIPNNLSLTPSTKEYIYNRRMNVARDAGLKRGGL